MLTSLFRHELSRFARCVKAIYIIDGSLLAAFALSCASGIELLKTIFSTLLLVSGLFTLLVTATVCAVRYSKTMFGEAGALTLTLPIPRRSIMIVKLIVSMLWMLAADILFFGTIVLIRKLTHGGIAVGIDVIADRLAGGQHFSVTFLVLCAVSILVLTLYYVVSVYSVISVAHLKAFNGKSLFASAALYMIMTTVVFGTAYLLQQVIPLSVGVTKSGIAAHLPTLLNSFNTGVSVAGAMIGIGGICFLLLFTIILLPVTIVAVKHDHC